MRLVEDNENAKMPLAVCTYAAISDEPGFNSTTKIVRISFECSNYELEWPIDFDINKKVYVQYPLNRNFILQLGSTRDYDIEEIKSLAKIHDDMGSLDKFNPSRFMRICRRRGGDP